MVGFRFQEEIRTTFSREFLDFGCQESSGMILLVAKLALAYDLLLGPRVVHYIHSAVTPDTLI